MAMSPRLLRPRQTGFNPKSISGLALWLDASDSSTLFQNSDGTVPATASSDPVGYWADKSGNNRHAVQATAGSRPTISATTQGGRKALEFSTATKTVVSPATVAQYVADATTSPKMFFAWVARPEGISASVVFGSPANPNNASRVFYAADYGAPGGHIVDLGHVSTARLTGTVGDEANNVGHVYSAFRDGAVMSLRRDGVEILRKTNASGVFSATTGTLSINTCDGGSATASWMEFLAYAASMPAANITRLERYLAARWGIALAPQVSNADAQDWVNRVYSNGGTVSSATAGAVNTLCDSLDAASLRDRFYRLNLFCGTGLNAALVPLYRGPSLGGTQYGNTTDTNVGPFVSGDFAETGASGGLKGNGSSKYLDTGVLLDTLHAIFPSLHMSAYVTATAGTPQYLGGLFSSGTSGFVLGIGANQLGGTTSISDTASISTAGMHTVSRTLSDSIVLYKNTTQVGSSSTSTTSATNASQKVFAMARSGATNSPVGYSDQYFRAYSLGGGMTAPQLNAYYTAMQAFQAAMTRNV